MPESQSGIVLSVVMPVFNRGTRAMRAIASATAQDTGGAAIEIIVVDDGSLPAFVYAGHDPRVRVLRLARNGGAPAARNAGIAACSGTYVALLDSDDVWLEGKLARQLAILRALEGAPDAWKTVAGSAFYCPNRTTGQLEFRRPVGCASLDGFASGCWFNPGTTFAAHREVFARIGPFDESLRRLEDLEWFLRFGQAGGRLVVDPEPGAIVAPSGSARSPAVNASAGSILAKFGPGSAKPLPPAALRRLRAYLALERTAAFLAEGRHLRASASLAWSLALFPRVKPALLPFWEISREVPENIAAQYAEMVAPTGATGSPEAMRRGAQVG